jgi:hypothetical protein
MKNRNAAESVAESYYDSSDADIFYERVWSGEDIHIGLYESGAPIFEGSRKTVELMATTLITLDEKIVESLTLVPFTVMRRVI